MFFQNIFKFSVNERVSKFKKRKSISELETKNQQNGQKASEIFTFNFIFGNFVRLHKENFLRKKVLNGANS